MQQHRTTERTGTQELDPKAQEALAYGKPVFPCVANGKTPAEKVGEENVDGIVIPVGEGGHNQATKDPAKIARWAAHYPGCNWAMRAGEASGLDSLDIDVKHGVNGFESLDRLIAEHGPLPDTPAFSTPSGGRQYLFCATGLRNTAGDLAPGIDTRGAGGYFMLPSSEVDGIQYRWLPGRALGEICVADMPEWLVSLWRAASRKRQHAEQGARIPKGRQEAYCMRVAGAIRRQGGTEQEILAALTIVSQERCDPPISQANLERMSRSAASYSPVSELIDLPQTQVGNGARLVAQYGHEICYVKKAKRWAVYTGSHWELDDDEVRIQWLAKQTLKATHDAAATITDDAVQGSLKRWARSSESMHGIKAMVEAARSEPGMAIEPDELDSDLWLFNTATETVDLRTGEGRQHSAADLITKRVPISFDELAQCPRWLQFLIEVFDNDANLIEYVQRAVGHCLTGDTREQNFFVAYGDGANGKSTFLNVVRRLTGDYGATVPFTTFDAENRGNIGNDVAALRGIRFVASIEAERERSLAEARVKSVTGGDPIRCRFLYGEFFEYEPQYKIWLAVNHRPNVRGTDHGIWRRVKLVPFTQRFEGDNDDKGLIEKLYAELPGILNWAIEGCLKWQQTGDEGGLREPEAVKMATKNYREESDTFAFWLDEQCDLGPDGDTSSSVLYAAYRAWSKNRGEERYCMGAKFFSIELERRGFEKHKKSGIFWRGIALKPGVFTMN